MRSIAKNDFDHALEYDRKALRLRKNMFGKEHPDTATSYNNVGVCYSKLGNKTKALEYYKEALEIRERLFTSEHLDKVQSYQNIASIYEYQGNYETALDYNFKALKNEEVIWGTEYKNISDSYNAIAWTYHLMGKYEEALPWAEKAVEAFPDNPVIIDTLATVYQGLSRYDEALEQFELCLKFKKEQNASEGSIRETEEKDC